jgi:hypothetical protein
VFPACKYFRVLSNSLRPCLLVRYFSGSEGNFPAHSLISEFLERPVYYSGIFEYYPGPGPSPHQTLGSRVSPHATQSSCISREDWRQRRVWRLEATARSHGAGKDACLGPPPTGITSTIGSGFSPVSSRASSPLLPSLLASGVLDLALVSWQKLS